MERISRAALIAALAASAAIAQSPRPAFEVADIKPYKPNANIPAGKARFVGGRLDVSGVTLKSMMEQAYGVQENMISGGPSWIDSDRFDIVAKAPDNTSIPTLELMVQSLLEERFHLAIHREDKPMPVYALTVAKGGPKMQESPSGDKQGCQWGMSKGERLLRRRSCTHMTMPELALALPRWAFVGIDRPVVDETGLKGAYNFEFDIGMPDMRRESAEASPAPPDNGPTIFQALSQVGLKLESRKEPVSAIVIDHVEKPSEN